MKKMLTLLFVVSLFMFMTGCTKTMENEWLPKPETGSKISEIDSSFSGFIIKTIIDNSSYYKRASIAYNPSWNPTKITVKNMATGYPNSSFVYSNGTKLLTYFTGYENGQFELWNKYSYTGAKITKDSLFFFGTVTKQGPKDYIYVDVIDYEYDAHNRISKTTRHWVDGDSIPHADVAFYKYDADGNLISGARYDHLINLHRVNPIWMFLACDYSMNNPFTAQTYTPEGLPSKMVAASLVHNRQSQKTKQELTSLHNSYIVGKPLGYSTHSSLKGSVTMPYLFTGSIYLNPGTEIQYVHK